MTSTRSIMAAFAIILIDLLGRAGLDKVLALAAGPAVVGLWAQVQSVVDVVSGVVVTGVLQGLTVTVSQARGPQEERALLATGLRLTLVTAAGAALVIALASPLVSSWLTQGRIAPLLVVLAALAGCFAAVPAALNAFWLGKQLQQRMLGLAALLGLVWVAVAAVAWLRLSIAVLALTQALALLLIAAAVWRHLKTLQRPAPQQGHVSEAPPAGEAATELAATLRSYIPVGLAIGIMSPASMLLVRGLLAGSLGWAEVGYLQALWRASEWVTSAMAGALWLVFLPRLSAAWRTPRFGAELARAGRYVLLPAAALLALLYFTQHETLALLYDTRFRVSNTTAALFLLGCWVRVGSWVFLNGLFAARRTRAIIIGEVLSLPLFVLLLRLYEQGMTLERTAAIYLAVYCVYLGFNATALMLSQPGGARG